MEYSCAWCGRTGTLTRGQKARINKFGSQPCCSPSCVGRYGNLKVHGWSLGMVLEQLEIVRTGSQND